MKKRVLLSVLCALPILTLCGDRTYADTVIASSEEELVRFVSSATEDRTIKLSSEFPKEIKNTIKLRETTNHSITIDGNGQTLTTQSANPILSYMSGGSSTGGYLTLENLNFNGYGKNARALYTSGFKGTFALDNVTVEDFHAKDDGSAMYIDGNTVITNSTFMNNSNDTAGYSGGAIAGKRFSGELRVENSLFENNETLALGNGPVGGMGGAMYFYAPTETASFTFKNNYFTMNHSVKDAAVGKTTLADGGAIAFFNILSGITLDFEGNTFSNNIAGDNGGAVFVQTNDSITKGISFRNNTFYNNFAQGKSTIPQSGGAIQIYNHGLGSTASNAYVVFTNNSFINNQSNASGAAIGLAGEGALNTSYGNFKNNLFAGNRSITTQKDNNDAVAGKKGSIKSNNDIGLNDATTFEDIFGNVSLKLGDNYSDIVVGSNQTQRKIPSISVAPEKKANKAIKTEPLITMDQRGIKRQKPSDAGAIDATWIKYDANGGIFSASNGLVEYDSKNYIDFNEPSKYYQLAVIPSIKVIPSGTMDLGINRDGYTFLGWSRNKEDVLPDIDLSIGTSINLSSATSEFYNGTLYAVWQKSGTVLYGANVTIKYQDTEGNAISDDVIKSGNIGDVYTSDLLDITGYTFKEVRGDASGTFSSTPQEIIYIYTKNPLASVVVKYVDEQGKTIFPDRNLAGNVGETYKTEKMPIDGYTYKEIKGEATGKFTSTSQEIIYSYTKDSNPSVLVKYQDEEENLIAPTKVVKGNVGEEYKVEKEVIEGYTFKEVKGSETGKYTTEPQEVIYLYTKNKVVGGEVLVRYHDVSGHPISNNLIKSGTVGEEYKTEQLTIEEYTFKEVQGEATGKFEESPKEVTYVYSKNPVKAANVTVKYQDEKGETISKDIILTGNVGEAYTSEQLSIPEYKFKEVIGKQTGEYQSTEQVVIYVYSIHHVVPGEKPQTIPIEVITNQVVEQSEDEFNYTNSSSVEQIITNQSKPEEKNSKNKNNLPSTGDTVSDLSVLIGLIIFGTVFYRYNKLRIESEKWR